jgi:hypothetical protein
MSAFALRLITLSRRRRPVVRRGDANGASVQRHYVASEAISLLTYDAETETLWISFTDGATVELDGFPEIELERWLAAKSIGSYWNAYLRGRY